MRNSHLTPDQVLVIKYKKKVVEPKTVNITVKYLCDGKELIPTVNATKKVGDLVGPPVKDGYKCTEPAVTVKEDTKTIEFHYTKNEEPKQEEKPKQDEQPKPEEKPKQDEQPKQEENKDNTNKPTEGSGGGSETPEPNPSNNTGSTSFKRPVAVSLNRPLKFVAANIKKSASTAGTETASLDMTYSKGVFTITATGNVGQVTVNGTAATLSNGKGTFNATKDGDYTLAGVPTWSDGVAATDAEKLSVTYTVSGFGTGSTEQLKDKEGNLLFLDEACSKPATAADYAKDKTYYYRAEKFAYFGWQTLDGASYYFDKNGNKVTGEQVIQGVKYNFGPDGALLVKGNGIDVSKYQGNIDWKQAKSAVSFAIIRCGYRGQSDGLLHEDPYFYQNMKGAKGAGVATGIYIFSRALNEAEAVQEASMAVAMANKAGGCAYPIYIDMEDTVRGVHKLSNAQRVAIVNAFVSTVQSSGYKAGVYCSKNWMTGRMDAGAINSSAYIWIAQYNTSCTYPGKYSMWQYSSKGSVPGIKGNVDMNKSFF